MPISCIALQNKIKEVRMRILTVFDVQSYSEGIVTEVAKLAANTWADITMLAVQPDKSGTGSPDKHLAETLRDYRRIFIEQFSGNDLPYGEAADETNFTFTNDCWQLGGPGPKGRGRKKLIVKIRRGDTVKEILAEAKDQESDLIVLGCTKGLDCQWSGEIDLPQKIAKRAACSVLVIKEKTLPDTIVCCLDQVHVSQASLEMINQIVTLHQAELKLIGLTGTKTINQNEVEHKMAEILRYYTARKISAWIKLVSLDTLEEYVARASREGMIGLWIGKKSLLKKIFSRDLVGRLVNSSRSSVLILR
jgi:hypothetical protein